MKAQCLAVLFSLITHSAFAGNEGPQAAPQPLPPKIIAQVISGSGFASPSSPITSTVDILADGRVQATEIFRDHNIKVKELAVLSAEVLAKLKALIQSTRAGKLVDPSPQSPACMDAPSTNFYAILASGERIAVGGIEACKKMEKENGTSSDAQIMEILQGFWSLANLY